MIRPAAGTEAPEQVTVIPAQAGSPERGRSPRIVVIDDVAANVDVLRRLLTKAGYARIIGFTDPEAALADTSQCAPDLVLLDLHMPGLGGLEVLRRLRAQHGESTYLPVVILTADISNEARREALAAGATDFLTKPLDGVEVILRARNLLETGTLYARLHEHAAVVQARLDIELATQREAAHRYAERNTRIDEALLPGQLSMVFQPFVDLSYGHVTGAEALARFHATPTRTPDKWFQEATDAGRLEELECHAIRAALLQLGELPSGAFMSVNVSATTATSHRLVEALAGHAPTRIVLELTEHARVEDYDELASCLGPFRSQGGRIAVDDAGAGYASLEHILRLRPDIIKLDIGLTRGIDKDPARRSLSGALVQFSREIGATLIAEGIESEAEVEVLRELGVSWGQGYHLGRPAPLPLAASGGAVPRWRGQRRRK